MGHGLVWFGLWSYGLNLETLLLRGFLRVLLNETE